MEMENSRLGVEMVAEHGWNLENFPKSRQYPLVYKVKDLSIKNFKFFFIISAFFRRVGSNIFSDLIGAGNYLG